MRFARVLTAAVVVTLTLLLIVPIAALAHPSSPASRTTLLLEGRAHAPGFNHPGNLLITDQFNNRVIEVDPVTKQVVWSFGSGNSTLCNPGPGSIIGSNWAERISGGLTILAGTGIPAGVPGTTACVDNRVVIVDHAGKIVWQYGKAGATGAGFDRLNVPTSAVQLPNHDLLITDQGNARVIEVNLAHQVVWTYPPVGGSSPPLNNPNAAELLSNGHILIADENNNQAIEVTRLGKIVWQDNQSLGAVAFASRLPNGHTLITDSTNNRILEVTAENQVVFQFATNHSAASNPAPLPTNAVRLANGDTVIADQFNNRVITVDPDRHVVFQYGKTNVTGAGFDRLFGPYTAFVIGDYTGQTRPPASFLPEVGDEGEGGD